MQCLSAVIWPSPFSILLDEAQWRATVNSAITTDIPSAEQAYPLSQEQQSALALQPLDQTILAWQTTQAPSLSRDQLQPLRSALQTLQACITPEAIAELTSLYLSCAYRDPDKISAIAQQLKYLDQQQRIALLQQQLAQPLESMA